VAPTMGSMLSVLGRMHISSYIKWEIIDLLYH
jgi:hypothetical protein